MLPHGGQYNKSAGGHKRSIFMYWAKKRSNAARTVFYKQSVFNWPPGSGQFRSGYSKRYITVSSDIPASKAQSTARLCDI